MSNLKLAKNGIKRDLITQWEVGIKCKKRYWRLGQTCKTIKFEDLIKLLMSLIDLFKGLIKRKIKFESQFS
jgi:hypothetical protein